MEGVFWQESQLPHSPSAHLVMMKARIEDTARPFSQGVSSVVTTLMNRTRTMPYEQYRSWAAHIHESLVSALHDTQKGSFLNELLTLTELCDVYYIFTGLELSPSKEEISALKQALAAKKEKQHKES